MSESMLDSRAGARASKWVASGVLCALSAVACSEDADTALEKRPEDLTHKSDAGGDRACGARLGDTCATGEFCNWTLQGICGFADATGVCTIVPQFCTLQYDPVCGCDGQTYSNTCAANAAGVSVQLDEPCPGDEDGGVGPAPGDAGAPAPEDANCGAPSAKQCGGFAGLPCGAGEFCNLEPEAGGLGCEIADTSGVCQPIPEFCTKEYAPVCGCDGQTYGNACTAHAAGVSIARKGECATSDGGAPDAGARICGGLTGAPCDEGEFCNFEGDPSGVACGAADGTGVCEAIPQACTFEYNPVCGCDDNTYGNACAAHAAGVSVASKGECAPQGGASVSCDPRAVLCRRGTPKCAGGQVPSVVGSCYGDCVPVEQCACSEAAACPLPDEYTCHLSAGHCGPYVN